MPVRPSPSRRRSSRPPRRTSRRAKPAPKSAAAKPRPPDDLNAAVAETVLRANSQNLIAKVRAGRTLSAAEVNLLESIRSAGRLVALSTARNQVELAQACGVSRKTVVRYLKLPGSPARRPDGRYEVAAWRAFLAANGVEGAGGVADQGGEDDGGPSTAALRAENLLLVNARRRFQNALEEGKYIAVADAERNAAELGAAIRLVVSRFHLIAPTLVGLSAPEIETLLKVQENEVLEQLHRLGRSIHAGSGNSRIPGLQ